MGLFNSQKVSDGSVHEASAMIENYYRHRGLNPDQHRLQSSEDVGWWLKEGSAEVFVVLQESIDGTGAVLRISSPLVFLPAENREAFYRRLLDINNSLSSCALATFGELVLVVSQRSTKGLIQEELDELVWNAAYVADLLDNKLCDEFGAKLYSEGKTPIPPPPHKVQK
jgi:hypothetical protein